MENTSQVENKSFFSLDRWLLYTEIIAIIGFVGLAAIFTQRGGAAPKTSSLSQVETLIAEADAHFDKQDLSKAIFLYWQALQALETEKTEENESDRLHVNLRIAEIYSQSSWFKDAKARLQHALNIQPDHEDVLLLSGKFFRDDTLSEEAVKQFNAVIDQNPDNAEAQYLLGVLYQGNKQYEAASKHYINAIESDPELCMSLLKKLRSEYLHVFNCHAPTIRCFKVTDSLTANLPVRIWLRSHDLKHNRLSY
jgi:tetratricopeptide (TPR) repeat protein